MRKFTSTSNLRPQRSKNLKKTTYACVVVVSSMVVDTLGLDEGRLRRYSETEGVNNVSIGSGLA